MCLLRPPGYLKTDELKLLPYWVDVQADLSFSWSQTMIGNVLRDDSSTSTVRTGPFPVVGVSGCFLLLPCFTYVLFVRLFDVCLFGFCLFGFDGFLFLLVSGKGCGL